MTFTGDALDTKADLYMVMVLGLREIMYLLFLSFADVYAMFNGRRELWTAIPHAALGIDSVTNHFQT